MRVTAAVRWTALGALVVARSAPSAQGQELLEQAFGSSKFQELGFAIAANGPDLDGDGFAEIAVGSRIEQSAAGSYLGSATVLSGRDLTPMHEIDGVDSGDLLGNALAWCDDLDADGLMDLVVGVEGMSVSGVPHAGAVQIYSTGSWALLREFDGTNPLIDGSFGGSLSRLGDLDGDGVAELIVGAPGEINAGGTRGTVYVYSGASGALLRSMTVTPTDGLGTCVADVGDVNGDGLNDIGAGAPDTAYPWPYFSYAGTAYVFSGADGSVLHQWHGTSKKYRGSGYPYYYGDFFGTSIGAAGDVDGDGTPDLWVSTVRGLPEPAFTAIYSGATGALIRTIDGVDIHQRVFAVGDVDGDGITDFGAGGWIHLGIGIYHDAVVLLSGSDGRELWRGERADAFANWGSAFAATGDVNHDGIPDFAVGAYGDSTIAHDAGRLDLLATSELWLDVQRTHFPKAGDALTLTALEGPPGNLVGLFLTGVNGAPTFSLLQLTTFDATGQAQWSSTVPSGYSGVSFALRALAIGATGKLVASIDETIAIQ